MYKNKKEINALQIRLVDTLIEWYGLELEQFGTYECYEKRFCELENEVAELVEKLKALTNEIEFYEEERFNLDITWKHTSKHYRSIDFEDVNNLVKHFLEEFEDLPDPKIKIEIFREYE